MAADVVKLTGAKTVNGQSVKTAVDGGKVNVDGANVVKTDIGASNGVIHVRETVLPIWCIGDWSSSCCWSSGWF